MLLRTNQGPPGQSRPIRLTDPRIFFAVDSGARDAVTSLWALDSRLADQLRATREPALAQIRLRWWQDALESGDSNADPLLAALRSGAHDPAQLLALAAVWEDWLCCAADDSISAREIAQRRGAVLFGAAVAGQAGQGDGRCWSLVDLALSVDDDDLARAMMLRAAQSVPAGGHGALALLDRWALRVARRGGAAAPARDAAWLFGAGLVAALHR